MSRNRSIYFNPRTGEQRVNGKTVQSTTPSSQQRPTATTKSPTLVALPLPLPKVQAPPVKQQIPWRCEEILAILRDGKIHSVLTLAGASEIVYKDENDGAKPINSSVTPEGFIQSQCNVTYRVNAGNRPATKIIVALDGDDTYHVRMWQANRRDVAAKTGIVGKILYDVDGVYCDSLADVCNNMYDQFLKDHCGGFLPI